MADVIRSIFRQREIEKLYDLCAQTEDGTYGFSHITKTKIRAIGNTEKVISDKEIGRYDIEIPMLNPGDEFFLHDIKEVVVIESRMRSSDGSTTYYVEDKIVETENTKKTYEECMDKISSFNKLRTDYLKLENDFSEYIEKYKYPNRFFNKKLKK